ncbi:MAG: sulfatase [Planctomycetota bacterium]|nr:sulfatase [Planctomycetota bacterium]
MSTIPLMVAFRSALRTFVPLTVALAACGEPAPPGSPEPLLVRLDLVAAGESSAREPTLVEVFDIADLEQRMTAPRGKIVTRKVHAAVALELAKGSQLNLQGPFPDEPFDRLVLELFLAPGGEEIHVQGWAQGTALGSSTTHLMPSGRWRSVMVPLKWMHTTGRRPTRLSLQFKGMSTRRAIRRGELRYGSPESWLPEPGSPDLVRLGTDARRAVGISTRTPLETTFEPALDARLGFGFALPQDLNTRGSRPRLRVSLLRDGEELLTQTFPCAQDQWKWGSVPVDDSDPRPITARFELLADKGRPAVAVLEGPLIEPRLEAPPVVVLVTTDTYRADHVGVAGRGVEVDTPFLDALARRGVFFEDCHAPTNVTNPSHISLMTAKPVRDHLVHGNDVPLGEQALTLAECFAEEGWATYAAVSVRHLRPWWSGLAQGFDRFSGPDSFRRDSSETIAVVQRWLEEPRRTPLFIWLHVFDAHSPYLPPEPFKSMYWSGDGDPFDPSRPRKGWKQPHWLEDVTDPDYVIALYKGEVTYLDARLGSFFEHPRLKSALIAVVADHGEHLLSRGRSFGHAGLAPATLEVPLLIAGPGVPGGLRIDRPVLQYDLGRTLLDLAGLTHRDFPGTNLLLESAERPTRFSISANALSSSVCRGRWMLVHKLYGPAPPGGSRVVDHRVRLFDIYEDPKLEHDLADERHDLVCELRTELVRWLTAAPHQRADIGPRREDEGTLEQLAELGYAASSELPSENRWVDPECDCKWCERFPVLSKY